MLKLYKSGNPNNPTLIFFHGFMGTHEDFAPLIQRLNLEFHCISFDLPGHGLSQSILPSSLEEFEEILLKTLQPFLDTPCSLIGYSMGGRIALQLAKKINLFSLVLISTSLGLKTKEEREKRVLWDLKMMEMLRKDSFFKFLQNWYSLPLFKTLKKRSILLKKMMNNRLKQSPNSLQQILKLLSPATFPDSFNFISSYDLPILYLAGSEDEKYQKELQYISQVQPKIQTASIAQCSHALHIEAPEEVYQIIQPFQRYSYDHMERR